MWDKVWNDVIIPVLEASFNWINQFFTAIPEFKNLVISIFVIMAVSRFILFPLLGISNSIFRQEVTSAISDSIRSAKRKPKSYRGKGNNQTSAAKENAQSPSAKRKYK